MRSKISDTSVAVWALKAVFYRLDPDGIGVARLDDLLVALSNARRPCGTPLVPPADGRSRIEANQHERTTAVLGRLRAAGVQDGKLCGDRDGDGGDGLMQHIVRLLGPRVSKHSEELETRQLPWVCGAA